MPEERGTSFASNKSSVRRRQTYKRCTIHAVWRWLLVLPCRHVLLSVSFWLQWMASSTEQGNICGVGVRDGCHRQGSVGSVSGADSRTVSNDSVFAESPGLLSSRRLELDVCCLEMGLLHSVADSRCLPCSSASGSCRCCAGHRDERDAGELQHRTFQQGKQVRRACKYNHRIFPGSCGYKRWRNCFALQEPLEAS